MKQDKAEKIEHAAEGPAGLRLVDGASGGNHMASPFRSTLLARGLLLLSGMGCFSGALLYLFYTGHIGVRVKNFYSVSAFVFMFMGALLLTGRLNTRRVAAITVNLILANAFEYVFYGTKMIALILPVTVYLYVWWTIREPDMMEEFGLSRDNLMRNIVSGAGISMVFGAYVAAMLSFLDMPLKFDLWKNLNHFMTMLGQNLPLITFVYVVWSRYRKRGISFGGHMMVLAAMMVTLQIPYVASVVLAGRIGVFPGGFVLLINSLMMVMVLFLTFRRFNSAIPAVLMVTTIQEVLKMTGRM